MRTLPPLTRLTFCLSALAWPGVLSAGPSKTSVIDDFCLQIRRQFVEGVPQYFAGPDPWLPLDNRPASFASPALASVYSQGVHVRWLVLEMQGPGNAWAETTQYFFDQAGLMRKRERLLDQFTAHIQIREEQYFDRQKMIKTVYHHAPLSENNASGDDKQNWDAFYDPDAPLYRHTADLPAEFLRIEGRQLARLEVFPARWRCHPC